MRYSTDEATATLASLDTFRGHVPLMRLCMNPSGSVRDALLDMVDLRRAAIVQMMSYVVIRHVYFVMLTVFLSIEAVAHGVF